MQTVKKITLAEAEQASKTLHKAFATDSTMQWLAVTPENYERNGLELFQGWVTYAIRYGLALRTPDFESVAIRRKPDDLKFSIWKIFRSGMFKTPSLLGKVGTKRLEVLVNLSEQAKKEKMANQKFWYCWMLGTLPDKQGQGFGKKLMEATFEIAKQDNLPCYLETEKDTQAEKVHIHMGYNRLMDIPLPDTNLVLTTMLHSVG